MDQFAPRLEVRTLDTLWTLHPGGGTYVGGAEEADLLLDNPEVSRRHFSLSVEGDSWQISDFGSTNGVFVDGALHSAYRVEEHTKVVLGSGTGKLEASLQSLFEPALAETIMNPQARSDVDMGVHPPLPPPPAASELDPALDLTVMRMLRRLADVGRVVVAVISSQWLELGFVVWLTAWASAMLGLLASSPVRTCEQTTPVLVVLVIVQMVMTGGMIPVTDRVKRCLLYPPTLCGKLPPASGLRTWPWSWR